MTQEHELKTWSAPFQGTWDGHRVHEVRKDDRHFSVGDTLRLREYDPRTQTYSGREVHATVTWLSRGQAWGLPEGLTVMSIRVFAKVDPAAVVPWDRE